MDGAAQEGETPFPHDNVALDLLQNAFEVDFQFPSPPKPEFEFTYHTHLMLRELMRSMPFEEFLDG